MSNAEIDIGLQEIWDSIYVQGNPKKTYRQINPSEYDKVKKFLEGGPEPDYSNFTKLGKGLTRIKKENKKPPVDPPLPPNVAISSPTQVIQS